MSRSVTPTDEHVQAVWNGIVIADSDHTIMVEGNHYFPPQDIRREYFAESQESSHCPWKGDASYYDVIVGGERNAAAGWYYPAPYDEAAPIKDHVAFWRGVEVKPA